MPVSNGHRSLSAPLPHFNEGPADDLPRARSVGHAEGELPIELRPPSCQITNDSSGYVLELESFWQQEEEAIEAGEAADLEVEIADGTGEGDAVEVHREFFSVVELDPGGSSPSEEVMGGRIIVHVPF